MTLPVTSHSTAPSLNRITLPGMKPSPSDDAGNSEPWLERIEKAFRIDRLWQWAWDRHGTRYSWAVFALSYVVLLPIWQAPLIIMVFEGSDGFLVAAGIAAVAEVVALWVIVQPGFTTWRLIERRASGDRVDRLEALESTYTYARAAVIRSAVVYAFLGGLLYVVVGVIAGAATARLIQYGIIGTTLFVAIDLIAIHPYIEAFMRPVRVAISANSGIGDTLPRSRPTFATWSNVSILATAWVFALAGAGFAHVIDPAGNHPASIMVIATAMTLFYAVPITVGVGFAPSLRPIRDLGEGTERVAAGDYSQRLPVVHDDDLGALAASFNRMQAGLAERERLQAAFGSYVDPALATRLLQQGDDIFTGERIDVTVMFVDIRDFTPFAEANTAEDTVSHLNALFEIVVPAVLDAGGHVNKYLGDGALAVFGAPNALTQHADAAVSAALRISRLVAEHFDGAIRIGIGINTGQVIAGTIGGAGKLEFTLIGDTVNVAARIEQLTKRTGDTILLTQHTVDALAERPAGLVDRGAHDVKGKSGAIRVHGLN
jgi:class 3 adenylate cyclase